MGTLIFIALLICALIATAAFSVSGLFFLGCAFVQFSEGWVRRQALRSQVDEMASEISRQALQLDEVRQHMFLRWLQNHTVSMQFASEKSNGNSAGRTCDLEASIKGWLKPFPLSGQLWEFRLILTEIGWWRDLDHDRLRKLCLGNDR